MTTHAPLLSPAFVVRHAQTADIPALRRLIERSVRELSPRDYSPRQIEGALGSALGLDSQLIDDQTYFVITPPDQTSELLACGGWSRHRTLFGSDHAAVRDTALLDCAREPAKIRAFFVHPDWSRQGLATLLLDHCERAALVAGFRTVEMGSTLTGVPLYRLRGYEERKRLNVSLPNGEHLQVVHMTKTLQATR